MRQTRVVAVVAVLLLSLTPAMAPAGNQVMPLRVCQARYIALGYDVGGRFLTESEATTSADIFPEERTALQEIRANLGRWEKYVVVDRLGNAEIFLAIRLGRHASVEGGLTPGGRPAAPTNVGGTLIGGGSGSAQVSTSSDTLAVYEVNGGGIGMQQWKTAGSGGLAGVPPKLYMDFRTRVEKATVTPAP